MTIPADIVRISSTIWEIPPSHKPGMRVPARIYATEKLLEAMDAGVFEQVTNVATLPGIVRHAYCMPDGHWGYGFPIGGVAAMDAETGVISPGGIGFDINCGMRLVVTNLTYPEVQPRLKELVDALFKRVPAGVGSTGFVRLSHDTFREVITAGARWCVQHGYGWPADLERTEDGGCLPGADASKIGHKAIARGFDQIGTLGSGNHYLEVQVVHPEHVYDADLARQFGITRPEQIVIMFHCGSRGFGHQVATDYLQIFLKVMQTTYGLPLRDRELACAPFRSPEGQDYFAAMQCAAHMAFANRQVILHRIRMETGSYLLAGVASGAQTFFSTAHGSGRAMSRTQARKQFRAQTLLQNMAERGIYVRSVSRSGLTEEAGAAYKDIDEVVDAVHQAGVSRKVVRLIPIGNVKG